MRLSKACDRVLTGAAVFMVVTLSGCVIYDEHVEIDAHNGAVARVRVGAALLAHARSDVPDETILRELMARDLPPNVSVSFRKDGTDMVVTYTAKNVADLAQWARNTGSPLGNVTVSTSDGILEYTRTFTGEREVDLRDLDQFPDVSMVFELEGPGKILSSDAQRTNGNTASWEAHPKELFGNSGKTFKARFAVSTPWLAYTLIATGVLAVLAVFLLLLRKRA